jgi:protein-S-isoprenylcysteine O-methyltransferase Ste14
MGSITAIENFLVRRRVALGGLAVLVAIVFGDPTWTRWSIGFAIAVVGEGLRVWAAGHLEKNSEVTTSGPYRYMRHPLYSGTAIIAIGAMTAAHNFAVNLLALTYIMTTVPAAMRAEEAHLRSVFGDLYDRYTKAEAPGVDRTFSFERAMRNKEYRAVLGVLAGFGILALKVSLDL